MNRRRGGHADYSRRADFRPNARVALSAEPSGGRSPSLFVSDQTPVRVHFVAARSKRVGCVPPIERAAPAIACAAAWTWEQLGNRAARTPRKTLGNTADQKARRVNIRVLGPVCKTSIPGSIPDGASTSTSSRISRYRIGLVNVVQHLGNTWEPFALECFDRLPM
jgi:hypothetical protein